MTEAATLSPEQVKEAVRAQRLVESLFYDADPAVAKAAREKAKAMFPDITLPSERLAPDLAPLKADYDALKGQFDALQTKLTDDATAKETAAQAERAKDLESRINSARQAHGFSDEYYNKMLDRMRETGNYGDPEAAAAYIAAGIPKPVDLKGPTWSPDALNYAGSAVEDESLALLHTNAEAWEQKELAEAFKDLPRFTAEAFGQA